MLELDSSFELLSSMSPKIKKSIKVSRFRKSPSKLSLKKHFRRSSIYDKKPVLNLDDSVILIEDSFEDKENNPLKTIVKVNTANTVSYSSESISDSDQESTRNNGCLDTRAFPAVEKWLSDNANNSISNTNEKCKLMVKNNLDNLSDNCDKNTRKIFNISGTESEEDIRDTKKDTVLSNYRSKNLKSSSEDSQSEQNTELMEKNNSFEQSIENYETILDNLYGTSWRIKRDDILPQSEKKPTKKTADIKQPLTERKIKRKKLFERNIQTTPLYQNLKKLCDSDTDSSFSDSYKDLPPEKSNMYSSDDDLKIFRADRQTNGVNKKYEKCKIFRKHSDSSDLSNSSFDDSLNLNDSLRTRIQKKLFKTQGKKEMFTPPKKTVNNKKSDTKITEKKKKENFPKQNNNNLKNSKENKLLKNDKEDLTKHNNNILKNSKENKLLKNDNISSADITKKNDKFSFLYSLSERLPSFRSDPEARYFRDNYKTQKEELAKKLFALYNSKIFNGALPADTPIEWNNRVRQTAGFCYNRRVTHRDGRIERVCRIVLAPKVLDSASRLRDTLVHELCHAATWVINNVADGHGHYWKAWAQKAMNVFPELPPIKRCHDYVINTKYSYKCENCGYSIGRHTKSLDTERKRCGYCLGKFQLFINKESKTGDVRSAPVTPRAAPSPFAAFVKQNYRNVRTTNMKHGDAMKILGERFAKVKLQQEF